MNNKFKSYNNNILGFFQYNYCSKFSNLLIHLTCYNFELIKFIFIIFTLILLSFECFNNS